jgi:hypothetical protein
VVTRVSIQYRETTSTMAYTDRSARVKWVASQIQIRLGSQGISGSTGAGRPGRGGSPGSVIPASLVMRNNVEGDTYTRPRYEPRYASLRCVRSVGPHSSTRSNTARRSQSRIRWTGLPPGARSSRVPILRRRARQRCTLTSETPNVRHARAWDQPSSMAQSISFNRPSLTSPEQRRGTRARFRPNAIFL